MDYLGLPLCTLPATKALRGIVVGRRVSEHWSLTCSSEFQNLKRFSGKTIVSLTLQCFETKFQTPKWGTASISWFPSGKTDKIIWFGIKIFGSVSFEEPFIVLYKLSNETNSLSVRLQVAPTDTAVCHPQLPRLASRSWWIRFAMPVEQIRYTAVN